MVKKRIKKKLKHISLIALITIVIIFIIYFCVKMFIIHGQIIEDKPLLKIICKLRPFCYSTTGGSWGCTGLDEAIGEGKKVTNELLKWSGYHGCNESTRGFRVRIGESTGKEYGEIWGIEHCTCPQIIG